MASTDLTVPPAMLAQIVAGRVPPLEPLTIEQVEQMVRHGILNEGAPVELIDGLLVRKDRGARGDDPMTHNPVHAACLSRLLQVLSVAQTAGFHLRCQLPIALLPTRAPEPDIAIIRGPPGDYGKRHPGPNDVAAVFEVADSSLEFDRTTKLRLYAAAGIPVYWIVNLIDQAVEVYERPNSAAEKFDIHADYKPGNTIELSLRPNSSFPIRVDEILG
jgi:hypothetical protein